MTDAEIAETPHGGRFLVAVAGTVAVVVSAAVLLATFGGGSTPSTASGMCRDSGGPTPRECAIALRVGHREADRFGVHDLAGQQKGWPANVRTVAMRAQTGTVASHNVGPPCRSGRLLSVDLIGTFDIVVSPPPGVEDTAVHDVHLYVDDSTGRACLLSVRTGHVVVPPGATVLFRRR